MDTFSETNKDLTIIYYTANHISDYFMSNTLKVLLGCIGNIPIISVSQKPMSLGKNICVGDIGRSHLNIYRQALIGAKEAKTKYIALVEDDVLYTKEHFEYKPIDGVFSYNVNIASIYSWVKPAIFSFKYRKNLHSLICERQLFIDAMEERFKKHPVDSEILLGNWGEPGRVACEKNLGVTQRQSEEFKTSVPNVTFFTKDSFSFLNLGFRKKLGNDLVNELNYWGKAEDVLTLYENN